MEMSAELINRINKWLLYWESSKNTPKDKNSPYGILKDCKSEIERLNTECDRYSVAVNNCNGGSLCSCAINFNTQGNDL